MSIQPVRAIMILGHSPSTRRRCSSRISSAMLVRGRRTRLANVRERRPSHVGDENTASCRTRSRRSRAWSPTTIERAKRLIELLASALAIRKINRLKLALHVGGTLTDKHGLIHCNERGRARTDSLRVDNGDNLRRRDISLGAVWPDQRDEKSKEGCENCCHILMPLANPCCS